MIQSLLWGPLLSAVLPFAPQARLALADQALDLAATRSFGDLLGVAAATHYAVAGVVFLSCVLLFSRSMREAWQRVVSGPGARRPDPGEPRQTSENALGALFSSMTSLVAEIEDSGRIARIIPTRSVYLKALEAMAPGRPISSLVPALLAGRLQATLAEVRRLEQPSQEEYALEIHERMAWFLVTVSPLTGTSMLVVARDITRLKSAQEELYKRERYHSALMENSTDLILVIDEQSRILFESPSVTNSLGYPLGELSSRDVLNLVHPEDCEGFQGALEAVKDDPRGVNKFEMRVLAKNGAYVHLEVQATNLLDDAAVGGIVLNSHNITERKAVEEELKRHVFLDSLTGLPNRALFIDRLGHAMARMSRKDHYQFAVLYIDLDRFKVVNESLGHRVGDALLMAIGQRLESALRKVDTVARFVADEFVLLLDEIDDEREAIRIAERIKEDMAKPHHIDGLEIFADVTIGIAYSSSCYETPDQIIRDAQTAMHWAKTKGAEGYKVFHSRMHKEAVELLRLETDMRRALGRKEFILHYQPIVRLDTGQTVGAEALLRWRHPTRGLIPPMEFIPLAEETGLISAMGEWALFEACRQMTERMGVGVNGSNFSLSVNLSAKQLQGDTLADMVREALRVSGMKPCCLKLEVTESMVMANPAEAMAILAELKELGLTLAIDDFGTGYSSLSHLYQFPFDTLKIDKSFVHRLAPCKDAHSSIIQAIMALAKSLDMNVVAEGVETEFQRGRLSEMGCVFGQGFHFSQPVAPEAFRAFLHDNGKPLDLKHDPAVALSCAAMGIRG